MFLKILDLGYPFRTYTKSVHVGLVEFSNYAYD
jgi:hypothetical protein